MNYIEQFMKDNDIKINEEFYVIDENGKKIGGLISIIFYFDKNMRLNMKLVESDCRDVLRGLMTGECKIEKIKPKTVWDLKERDKYYFIDIWGDVEIAKIRISTYSTYKKIVELGNAFLTKEEAEFEVERRKCEAILLKYGTRDMMSLGDGNKSKYCIYLNNFLNKIVVSDNYCIQSQGSIYFESKELAQKAIDECGEDRLKKYVFNKVNDKITIEFRNNNIVRKRKKKQYKYVLDVNCGDFSKGCVFNEYEEIKDILDSVQEIRKCD